MASSSSSSFSVNQVDLFFFSRVHDFSPNRDTVEKIVLNLNALGANRPNHPSRQERGLRLVIDNKEDKLEALEARRTTLLQELDRVGE
jgi:hypothetical protein